MTEHPGRARRRLRAEPPRVAAASAWRRAASLRGAGRAAGAPARPGLARLAAGPGLLNWQSEASVAPRWLLNSTRSRTGSGKREAERLAGDRRPSPPRAAPGGHPARGARPSSSRTLAFREPFPPSSLEGSPAAPLTLGFAS